jgi:cobalt/nickel transport system permease protein
MHMSDALVSPAVGIAGHAGAALLVFHAAHQTGKVSDPGKPPLMGVLGAFVFAAQMLNFSLPGTGSSGHLGGGLLLAALLGPYAGLLVMASVLAVQALLFADGGLLALGCNLVNLGAIPCLVAYPLVFRPLAGREPTRRRLGVAAILASVVGLGFGALLVVVETALSGISALPPGSFLAFMLPIHAAIGAVEGLVTAGVLGFVAQARPELLRAPGRDRLPVKSLRSLIVTFAAGALLVGGLLSWFASTRPDGLKWAMDRASGLSEVVAPEGGVHGPVRRLQRATARFPDYSPGGSETPAKTSLLGVAGALMTLGLALLTGFFLSRARSRGKKSASPRTS